MRIKGIIAYDGTRYFGFQIQNNQTTIQGELVKVISKILNEDIRVFGSGRTDKGVHALNQVIHFDTNKKTVDLSKLMHGINSLLPNDILIKNLEIVDDSFHSRISATKKHYRYVLSLEDNPFEINYALIYKNNVNIALIKEAMDIFVGKHNFCCYCANNEEENDYEKEIYSFDVTKNNNHVVFDVYGNGFKRYMVRMLVGTILAYNEGKVDKDFIISHLNLPLGNNVSYKAPSQGLYLVEVFYD